MNDGDWCGTGSDNDVVLGGLLDFHKCLFLLGKHISFVDESETVELAVVAKK